MALGLQLAGSLVAILLVFLLTRWLGLGGDVRIRDEDTARRLADEAVCGFDPVDVALDRAGIGALLRDGHGARRGAFQRRHGAHFAARLVDDPAGVRLDRNFLTIATGDRWFGKVTLDLGPAAQVWASSFRRLGGVA